MRTRALSLLVSLLLVASAPSAFADEGDEGTPEASDIKVELLADFFVDGSETALDAATASVTELRASGIGWGALFKIYKLAAAMGIANPSELVGDVGPDGEYDFAFGELKKALDEDGLAVFDSLHKNFGSLKSASVRSDKATEKVAERDERKAEKKAARQARKEARDAAKAARDAANDADDDADDAVDEVDGSED